MSALFNNQQEYKLQLNLLQWDKKQLSETKKRPIRFKRTGRYSIL
mgnify:CR=1 FL=1